MEPAPPPFGSRLPGVEYRARPGAYALVFDDGGRVALVHEEGDWYLPGGGIEPGETHEEALVREVLEECACGVSIAETFGEAIEYLETRAGKRLEVRARYFRARFLGAPAASWLAPAEACALVRRRSDAWAIAAARSQERREAPREAR